jgi:hypothetical protein
MFNRRNFFDALTIVGVPIAFALIYRFTFDIDRGNSLWAIMSLSFLLSLPYIVGVITVFVSRIERARNIAYRVFAPWIPILGFLLLTLLIEIEGWACWLMILPIFLFFASVGGITAGYLKVRRSRQSNVVHISLAVLLPFLISPLEQAIATIPGFYEAYTYIDIESDAESIWNNVTRVSEIKLAEDQGWLTNLMQIPRPIRAELDFEGVGAKREAIFDGGLVFNETVFEYEHQKLMRFSIKANTYEIPSTTFDDHILIGGTYFDVLQGTYELEKLSERKYRLHLYSNFKLNTTFNFYASIWGRWIMKDIQRNILNVIKSRSEVSIRQ